MNILKKIVAVLLTVCLLFGMVPMSVSATETDVAEPTAETAATTTEFIKAFNLDCGRIYFSVDQIKAIIDQLSANDYTHLGLAFGNSGFRFLLDDMSVGSYNSDAVKTAILAGNTYYVGNDGHNNSSAANTCLTQAEMDTIIAYATSKNISIIPVLNSPGHMNTIVYAMGQLGISDAGYPVTITYNSESTININNETVTTFTNALIQKYITYFAGKGCTMFNIGADEFANDPTDDSKLGFQPGMKDAFISYVNNVAAMITTANMTPMMFNDGYAWSDASFNNNIVICYWTSGAVSSTAIANAGHKLINTSQKWYYVLGEPFGTAAGNWCSYASATNGVNNVSVTTMIDGGTVGDSLIGAQMCLWCDYTDKEYTDEEVTKVSTLISTLATNNPTYFSLTSDDTETTEPEAETRSITVAVNGTATDTISGYTYNEYTNTDSTKASVALETVEGVAETTVSTTAATELEAGVAYIIRVHNTTYALSTNTGSGAWGTNTLAFESNSLTANEDHLWTLEASGEGYKLKSADGYLNLGTRNNAAYLDNSGEVFTITNTTTGWTICNQSGKYINALGGLTDYYTAGGWNGDGTRFDLYKVTQASVDSTGVTFTGLKVGTTDVTVGHVTYTVTVIEEDFNNVTLTYHPWISTYSVHADGYGSANCNNPGIANPQTLTAAADGVHSETGVVFANFVWATGDWRWEEDAQTYYWKATVLPEGVHQENEQAIDCSMSGTDFTYIRYWGGVWSYSADRIIWTEVQDTDEVCAYYLQKTEVTAEVDTYVKDWAFTTQNSDGKDENRYQKALSFSVVYPDGTMNPSEDDIYAKSTLIYWDNLADLGFIRIGVTDYEVSKITYTLGARTDTNPESVNWTESDSITWNKTAVGDTTWYDETICWDESYGTEPVINGQDLNEAIYAGSATSNSTNYNGTWGANDAVLILIYLKPIVTEDSLTVVYYDEKFGNTLYTYNITVPTYSNFNNGIGAVSTTGGNTTIDITTKPGTFKDNDDRIDVTGFGITNNLNVIQSFQTDLTKVPEAIGKYNSALYKYTGSVISEDGKTLYLYYNIDTTVLSPNYVVDFGLPITFNLSELLGTGTEADDVTAVSGLSARYGTLTYDSANQSFKYTPTSILQNIDVLSITLTIDGKTNTTNVGVTPATTVYYEESFLTWDSNWTGGNEAITVGNQTKEVLGEKKNNFGYDPVYANTTAASNETNASTSTISATATFTFTGDGIQVFANSTESTGYVAVQVKNSSGAIVNMAMVDTVVDEGTTAATSGQSGKMYGLPIVSLIDLKNMPHDTYTVTITKIMDNKPVYIDGIRVFNTMENSTIFAGDLEDDPNFYELRDMVLNAIGVAENISVDYKTMYEQVYDAVEGATALITDESVTYGNSNTIQDLLDNGPKNEVYLYTGQTLTFKVSTNRVMQIGMKAPQAATIASISVEGGKNTTSQDIKSSVDMFYTLTNKAESETTYTVQIKNTGRNILSITELKICDDPNATFVPFTEEEIKNIMCGEPEETEDQPAKEEDKEVTPDKPAVTFKDIKEGSFYYDSVYWAVRKDITQGIGDSLFNPEGTCTRAQVVTFLWRAAGEPKPETTKNPFVDVEEGAYYYDAVLWAYENGITLGLDEEHFDPEGACTRAQVVTFLWRVAEKPKAETAKNPFEDVKKDDYYYDAVLWAYKNGITNGISDTQFQIDGTCKRAQAVTFLYRMYE